MFEVNSKIETKTLINESQYFPDRLIEYLHRINDYFGCLPKPHLSQLSKLIGRNEADVFGVASFYHHFKIVDHTPLKKITTLRICNGFSCCMAGSRELAQSLSQELSTNSNINIVDAPCVGRCEQAPVAVLHQYPIINATTQKVLSSIAENNISHPPASDKRNQFSLNEVVHQHNGQIKISETINPDWVGLKAYKRNGGFNLLESLRKGDMSKSSIIDELIASKLRGLGGAGFSAGRKWDIVSKHTGPRYLVANLDEGEPGTFKDRNYLERDPHRFLEGLLIAAYIVGISRCFIYLRDEYHGCRQVLSDAIRQIEEAGIIDRGFIDLRRGAGAYICGEESALIESIEGKRGEPRHRPPYVAETGLFGHPSLVHNFETLFWIRDIIKHGSNWFTSHGRRDRSGLRSFSMSGRIKSPGVKLAPAGITLHELIEEYCGGMQAEHELYGYLPGGASGGILPARLNNIPLDFDTLSQYGCFIGSAAIVVMSHIDKARDAATNAMAFFADESCGQCSPCRIGTGRALNLMHAEKWDQESLGDLISVLRDASICGLGQAAPNVIESVNRFFPSEVINDE
ncbi:NAD(P)H-dependent oxidoreductase subunit E [Litorivicinus sp.]|nr:NAD(P)H-dependent oxidoreductase subunit E [Litorivicinus sp.]